MITGFRHRGLKRLFEKDDGSKLPPEMVRRIREILTYLDAASDLEDMNRPTFRLHRLKGNRKGEYAVDVRGPWCIVFRFHNAEAFDVNFEDYH
ncbi:peptidase [Notoacmeibacter marinus]|uniref:Peptidase n=1 Tax=Notoacmeibacter marinus TaxID=1876515 RepID=A0A231V0A3_9HYPH|nr:type II toxin-antitoxin system RelE/ParE family toxin [Notoacmeibacter marinus]OXT01643.1 peptidase [Notoacmeibacter marinus]